MDKLLIVREKVSQHADVSLCVSSAPKRSEDNVLYCKEVENIKSWIIDGIPDAGFVCGICGSGVSTLVSCILKELRMEPYYIDHSDKNFIKKLQESNLVKMSIDGRPIIVVIDGLDSSSADKRCLKIVAEHVAAGSTNKFLCVGHYGRSMKSNDFAQKWTNFTLEKPTTERLEKCLLKINDGKIPEERVRQIAHSFPNGDFRSCVNCLEMEMKSTSEKKIDTTDVFVDGIDAIEYMFKRDENTTFGQIHKIYEQEPMMISMGVMENYPRFYTNDDISMIADISDDISMSDCVYEKMSERQEWDMTYHHCALSVGGTKMSRGKTAYKNDISIKDVSAEDGEVDDGCIKKFGTIWSKINNQKSNEKKLASIHNIRRENGDLEIPTTELGYVRTILKNALKNNVSDKEFIDTCHPLKDNEVLYLFRTGFEPYKHAKVKKIFKSNNP